MIPFRRASRSQIATEFVTKGEEPKQGQHTQQDGYGFAEADGAGDGRATEDCRSEKTQFYAVGLLVLNAVTPEAVCILLSVWVGVKLATDGVKEKELTEESDSAAGNNRRDGTCPGVAGDATAGGQHGENIRGELEVLRCLHNCVFVSFHNAFHRQWRRRLRTI